MKNKLSLLILSLFAVCFFTACEDDQDPFNGPYTLTILGSDTVTPESTEEFTLGNFTNPESYTWSVEGPAEIVGSNTGATISVKFNTVGDAVLHVTNGTDAGTLTIEVAETEAAVTASLNGTGVLRSGESDTVFFEFAAPVSEIGDLSIITTDSTEFNGGETPFVSGTLGDLVKVSDNMYYAIYTAGAGNGTPEARFDDITSTATYGSVTIDTSYVQLYRVDNIDPVANLSYSSKMVNSGTEVTITATFSEQVMFATPGDSALYISLSGAGIDPKRDTLEATSSPLVYTYTYTVTGDGDGTINVMLQNIEDLAGNPLVASAISGKSELMVDNMAPAVQGSATDGGDYASIMLSSTEAGTGMFLVLKSTTAAPADAAAFMSASGVASGSVSFTAANQSKTSVELLQAGSYKVYYMAMDAAGNYSPITSSALVMD